MKRESHFVPEKQPQLQAFALTLAEKVREYFKDAEHRKQFEAWYMKEYGKAYKWERNNATR